jgi:hypothetical protein
LCAKDTGFDDNPKASALGSRHERTRSGLREVRLAADPVRDVLYLLNFLDRVNVGFAALTMNADLGFTPEVYGFVLWGRSSDIRGERIWHVALPFLLAAFGLIAASVAGSDLLVLALITIVVVGLDAGMGVFWTLPSTFLSGSAAAGAIALIRTISALGGFFGPTIVGACSAAAPAPTGRPWPHWAACWLWRRSWCRGSQKSWPRAKFNCRDAGSAHRQSPPSCAN